MPYELTRAFEFSAAHALPESGEGHKCRGLHGHNYTLEVVVRGEPDPQAGWVVDRCPNVYQALTRLGQRPPAAVVVRVDWLADAQFEFFSIARRRWRVEPDKMFSWYEPLEDADAIARAVRYVLSHDQLFLNTTSDARLLGAIFDAAEGDLTTPSDAEMRADIDTYEMRSLFDELTPTF